MFLKVKMTRSYPSDISQEQFDIIRPMLETVDLSDRILQDISNDYKNYIWSPDDNVSNKYAHSASTTEQANKKLESKLNLPFKATYQDISLGATYKSQQKGNVVNSKGTMVYTVFRIDSRKCTYKKIPSLILLFPMMVKSAESM